MSRLRAVTFGVFVALGGLLLLSALLVVPATRLLPFPIGVVSVDAQSVPHLSGQITDQAGVVGGGRSQLEQALANLLDSHDVQLYVAFVTTTGGSSAPDFAQSTYKQNSLGGNDLLLLVAVDDHRYGWYRDQYAAAPNVSQAQVDQLLSSTIEPKFRQGDYAGGVADFANALGDAVARGGAPATAVPGGGITQPTAVPSQPADMSWVGLVLGLLLILGGVVVVWARLRQWRGERLSAEERDRRTGQLARDANALLIRADDAIHEAQQELGFAEAEFDEADVTPFRDAIGQSQAELKAAFAIRQQLDDDVPESPETREQMLNEIVARCKRAGSLVEEQHRRIQQLRDLERTAPDVLAQVPQRSAALEARLPAAEATMAHLQTFAEGTWQAVKGNVEESRKRIANAAAEAQQGSTALAATPPDTRVAATSARRAQDALAQAAALLDAIDRLSATVDQARSRLDAEIADTDKDIADARRALQGNADAGLAAKLAEAAALLDGAKRQAASTAPDVVAADRDAQRAHATTDEVLTGVRAAEEQRARAQAALDSSIRTAEMSVDRAGDFIASRRHGVRREARTRLAEAQRHLEQARALVATDPASATSEARLAARLGDEAYDLARSDFDDWDLRGGGRRGGNDLTGAILGGIILGGILGGGRRGGGGWGGTPWGSPWGGGGWGGGGLGGFGGGQGGGGGWGGGGGGGGQGGGGSW